MRDDSHPDPSPHDRAAIEAVIEADVQAYLDKDPDRWCAQWVQAPRLKSIMECSGLLVHRSYAAFEATVVAAMETTAEPSSATVSRENLQIEVRGDLAWAYFDQNLTTSDDPMDPPVQSHNVRVLERGDDGWQIVFHGVWAPYVSGVTRPLIEVDASAKVLWQNGPAQRALAEFPGLTLRRDRLRGARPVWDKALRATIARAAGLQNYAAVNAAQVGRNPIRYPVVLGEDEDLALVIVWVEIADYRIFVSFGDTETLDRTIEIAAAALGLSPAQARLAREIADGRDLKTAARNLGVAPSSAKTQLRRMFEKTNVNSQTALIRLILSCA